MNTKQKNMKFTLKQLVILGVVLVLTLTQSLLGCSAPDTPAIGIDAIPPYSGRPYVEINGNEPNFTAEEKTSLEAFEHYAPLDGLKRCGVAFANICPELMPTEDRGEIGHIHPSGWHSVRYDFVEGKNLYNRCHLIGFQLAGENANDQNLVTGTRYMNTKGMLPFENIIADHVKETGEHVLYRVTPIFEGDELVCRGVQMEAWSVEDEGDSICFNIFCYNVQPGVEIDYLTGDSRVSVADPTETKAESRTYILNTNSKKFHLPDCPGVTAISKENREEVVCTREELIEQGYDPCGNCKP